MKTKKKCLNCIKKREKMPYLENQFERIQFCNNSYLLDSNDGFMKSLNLLQKNLEIKFWLKIHWKALILNNLASKETHPDYNIKAVGTRYSITALIIVSMHKPCHKRNKY
jgi:hypothetical protein